MSTSKQFMDSSARNVRFKSVNPFEALNALDSTDGGGKSSSSGSSDSSTSLVDAGVAVSTPSRGLVRAFSHPAAQHDAAFSPQQVRGVSNGVRGTNSHNGTASAPVSPAYSTFDLPTAQEVTYGSPNPRPTARQLGPGSARKPSTDSARKPSTGSVRKPSSGSHPRGPYGGGKADSLIGISEGLTVQELAFRQGQRDHQNISSTVPPSPFRKQFDQIWVSFYQMGRQHGGTPLSHPKPTTAQEHNNYAWPVLINPYTQSLDAPNGVIDQNWARRMCEISLNCMEALIRTVCKRSHGWEKTVIDIPFPVKEALTQFPDLAEFYDVLQRDAREALSGGRPYGY